MALRPSEMENWAGGGRPEVENGKGEVRPGWRFAPSAVLVEVNASSIRGVLEGLMSRIDPNDPRPVIPIGHGDPSAFPCFRTTPAAEEAVISAVRSGELNRYAPTVGLAPARRIDGDGEWQWSRGSSLASCHHHLHCRCRRTAATGAHNWPRAATPAPPSYPTAYYEEAVADYLSRGVPYKVSSDDIFLTAGCSQAIEVVLSVLGRPGANILLPRPGYPFYEGRAAFSGLEVRHFDLLPDKGWEVDLDAVEALADENTAAMVVINPGNPTGSVLSYEHLSKVAETARKLGIMVIADEVYGNLAFGNNPFVSMGAFGSIVPVLTLGSISKRWVVPGWRLGWIVAHDTNGVLEETQIIEGIKGFLNISTDPVTFIQGAIPQIIENTKEEFFNKTISLLKETADICYTRIKEINCVSCRHKPEGSMFAMVKLNLSCLEDISDDYDFCQKLAKEESVVILPGHAVGLKNWLRITFAIDPSSLDEGLGRLKSFCERHAKKAQVKDEQ